MQREAPALARAHLDPGESPAPRPKRWPHGNSTTNPPLTTRRGREPCAGLLGQMPVLHWEGPLPELYRSANARGSVNSASALPSGERCWVTTTGGSSERSFLRTTEWQFILTLASSFLGPLLWGGQGLRWMAPLTCPAQAAEGALPGRGHHLCHCWAQGSP